MVQNNPLISGNSDLTRVAFMGIIDHAVKNVYTKENVSKAFSATGVIPFNPQKIDVSSFPSSSAAREAMEAESPLKARFSECHRKDVNYIL